MPYLLNFVYLSLVLAASPWLLWSAVRNGKYREGYAARLFGLVPRRTSNREMHLAACGQRGRGESAGPAAPHDRARRAEVGVCHLYDDASRHGAGKEEIRGPFGFLLPVGLHLGRQCGHATDSAGLARAGRIGALAESRLGRAAARRAHGRDKRAIEPKELSRLPPRSVARVADAVAD